MLKDLIKIGLLIVIGLWSCEPSDEIIDTDFKGGLIFSADTVLFDTLFSSRGSTTRRFYVKNQHNKALNINRITLGNNVQSPYQLTVNGKEGSGFQDVSVLAYDSLLVLVKVYIDPLDQDLPYLVKDSILFDTNGTQQDVKLISWGQDANYLGDSILSCNAVWTNNRPYVLYKSILIDTLCNLGIEEGAKVFCASNTFIFVKGSIQIKGTAGKRIVIRNDRLEPLYENALGQWGGIVLLEGSKNNRIEYADIRNAQIGIRVGTPDNDTVPDVILKNVIIENMGDAGILSFTSDVYADNTLVNNCRNLVVGNLAGGNYTYINCTFANFSFDFIRETPSTYFSDYFILENEQLIKSDIDLVMVNSIIYGDFEEEIILDFTGETVAELLLANNILKTKNEGLDINDNILNTDPKFKSAFNYDFHLDTLSPAIDKGIEIGLNIDLDSAQRDDNPDIGAYEYIIE